MIFFMHEAEDDLNSSAQEIEQMEKEADLQEQSERYNDAEIDDAFEERELKRLMRKHADKIIGLWKELSATHKATAKAIKEMNEEYVRDMQRLRELDKLDFKITKIGG